MSSNYRHHLHEIFKEIDLSLPYSFCYLSKWISRDTLERARRSGQLKVVKGAPCVVKGEAFLDFIKSKIKVN